MQLRRYLPLVAFSLTPLLAGCSELISSISSSKTGDDAAPVAGDRADLEAGCTSFLKDTIRNASDKTSCTKLATLNRDELFAARDRGDYAFIGRVCSEEIPRDTSAAGVKFASGSNPHYQIIKPDEETRTANNGSGAARFSAKVVACYLQREKSGADTRVVLSSKIESCASGEDVMAEYARVSGPMRTAERRATITRIASGLAKCGKWDDLFIHVAHSTSFHDANGIAKLVADGHDVEGQFMKFLDSHQDMSFKYSEYAMKNMRHWLVKEKRFSHCQPFIQYYPKMPSKVQTSVIIYFANAPCPGSANLIAQNLASRGANQRAQACEALGMLGSKAHLAAVERLAHTDPEFEIKGLVKNYWVRNKCAQAANQIALK